VPDPSTTKSAAELFAEIGPWAGETTDEILALLVEARRHGAQRTVSDL
jgi:hypothetical protein